MIKNFIEWWKTTPWTYSRDHVNVIERDIRWEVYTSVSDHKYLPPRRSFIKALIAFRKDEFKDWFRTSKIKEWWTGKRYCENKSVFIDSKMRRVFNDYNTADEYGKELGIPFYIKSV